MLLIINLNQKRIYEHNYDLGARYNGIDWT